MKADLKAKPLDNLALIDRLVKAWDEGHLAPAGTPNPYIPKQPTAAIDYGVPVRCEPYVHPGSYRSLCKICLVKNGTQAFLGFVYCKEHCPCLGCLEERQCRCDFHCSHNMYVEVSMTIKKDENSTYCALSQRELTEQALLPFEFESGFYLIARTQKVFKPLGLMIWGADNLSVKAVISGNLPELFTTAYGEVPALWWSTQRSFEDVVSAVADGKQPGAAWGTWKEVYPGVDIRLYFDGPADKVKAVMWGMTT